MCFIWTGTPEENKHMGYGVTNTEETVAEYKSGKSSITAYILDNIEVQHPIDWEQEEHYFEKEDIFTKVHRNWLLTSEWDFVFTCSFQIQFAKSVLVAKVSHTQE